MFTSSIWNTSFLVHGDYLAMLYSLMAIVNIIVDPNLLRNTLPGVLVPLMTVQVNFKKKNWLHLNQDVFSTLSVCLCHTHTNTHLIIFIGIKSVTLYSLEIFVGCIMSLLDKPLCTGLNMKIPFPSCKTYCWCPCKIYGNRSTVAVGKFISTWTFPPRLELELD